MRRRFGATAPRAYNAPRGGMCEKDLTANIAKLPNATVRAVCDLIAIDVACFDLPLPRECG